MASPPLTHRTMPCTASRPTKHNQPPSRPDTTVSTHHAERRTSPLTTRHRAGSAPLRCQNVTTSCRQQRNHHTAKPDRSDPQILPPTYETTTQPGDQTRPQQHHLTGSERDKRDTPRHEVTSTTSKRRTTVGRVAQANEVSQANPTQTPHNKPNNYHHPPTPSKPATTPPTHPNTQEILQQSV